MNNDILDILSSYPDIRNLSIKATLLKELNTKIESLEDIDNKMELLEEYIQEFNIFLGECIDFYYTSIKNINKYISKVISEKDAAIYDLQQSVTKLTTQLLEDQYTHEKFMENLCHLVQTEPEKALVFLNNLGKEKNRQKNLLC